MSFLHTVSDEEASGEVAEIYAEQRESFGYVPASARALTTRPGVLEAYQRFLEVLQGGFTLSTRDWRLITFVADQSIPSTYCSLAYGKRLLPDLASPDRVLAVQRDFRRAGLSARDVVMLDYAEKVTVAARTVTQADVDRLRAHGFSDDQISDIALCATFRSFLSRFFDAVGTTPDEELRSLDRSFRDPLCVGRPLT